MRQLRTVLLLCMLLVACDSSGPRLVLGTTHTIDDGGYITKFKARREAPEEGA